MLRFIAPLLFLTHISAFAETDTTKYYSGKIATIPILMKVVHKKKYIGAMYFYEKYKDPIFLTGTENKAGTLMLATLDDSMGEEFELKSSPKGLSGKWHGSDRKKSGDAVRKSTSLTEISKNDYLDRISLPNPRKAKLDQICPGGSNTDGNETNDFNKDGIKDIELECLCGATGNCSVVTFLSRKGKGYFYASSRYSKEESGPADPAYNNE